MSCLGKQLYGVGKKDGIESGVKFAQSDLSGCIGITSFQVFICFNIMKLNVFCVSIMALRPFTPNIILP